eukprot:CAMPEP_0184740430 /NCGR_PEP_ID=MMETSP0315-20130426/3459_1 /TAXON_ID=101924 /ORGANISM="Rhodosorus marinus, Strain UTEX LB 2760" /LENGTH=407 /DNA_ID=CAMNT_0027210113 /DNA_START=168 /DNA_END=1391 /DNA_ORIENTATION=-
MKKDWVWSVAIGFIAIGAAIWYNTQARSNVGYGKCGTGYDETFSDNYNDARALFLESARAWGADRLVSVPLDEQDRAGLIMDFAVKNGRSDRLLIHMGGTHGVEGFAGSAIQSAFLRKSEAQPWDPAKDPTVIFVHAVNPYGFAALRRTNENNVDLNRNFLTDEQRSDRLSADPNEHGYEDFNWHLNPTYVPRYFDPLSIAGVGLQRVWRGSKATRRALLTGTYHRKGGLWYGGERLELSNKLLPETLTSILGGANGLAKVEKVILVDVHTGLGPSGYDTVSVPKPEAPLGREIFSSASDHVVAMGEGEMSGYDDMVGDVAGGVLSSLFPKAAVAVPVCHEFGTYPLLIISIVMRYENAATHWAPMMRSDGALWLRKVFYRVSSCDWRRSLLDRGEMIIDDALEYLR